VTKALKSVVATSFFSFSFFFLPRFSTFPGDADFGGAKGGGGVVSVPSLSARAAKSSGDVDDVFLLPRWFVWMMMFRYCWFLEAGEEDLETGDAGVVEVEGEEERRDLLREGVWCSRNLARAAKSNLGKHIVGDRGIGKGGFGEAAATGEGMIMGNAGGGRERWSVCGRRGDLSCESGRFAYDRSG
jgi:hypothetical protein